ncbi:MAG: PAS domain S-box protein, partial [Pseudomonadales bacterium]
MGEIHLSSVASSLGSGIRHHFVAGGLCVLVFLADLSFPQIHALGTAYISVVYVVSRLQKKRLIWGYAALCTLLILVGGIDDSGFAASADRVLSILALGAVTWIFHSHIYLAFNVSPLSRDSFRDDLLRRTFDSVPGALAMVDDKGVIQQANEAMLELFGYKLHELAGEPIEILIPGRYSNHVQLRNQYLQNPEKVNLRDGRDLFGLRRDGMEIPIEIHLNPVKTRAGQMVICSVVDISERVEQLNKFKKLSQDLAVANNYLKKTNRELDDFVYVASHDLRAPLRGIEHLASFVEEDAGDFLPPSSREDLALLRDRVKRLEDLISSLLTYSRIGRKEDESTWVDIRAVLENVLDLYVPSDRFQVSLPDDLPQVFAPLAAVELVFRNIVMNSVKHHDKEQCAISV